MGCGAAAGAVDVEVRHRPHRARTEGVQQHAAFARRGLGFGAFTNNSGAYNWELRDASNALVRSGTGTWTAGQSIRSDAWTPATPAFASPPTTSR